MNAQQRTLSDLKSGVHVQIDKGGKIRLGEQPMMDLPSVYIIDKSVVDQLEAELETEKQKHLDTSNWAEEQQDRADKAEAELQQLKEDCEPFRAQIDQAKTYKVNVHSLSKTIGANDE